ncbi:MAG: ROK family protein [Bacteroidales bacterium]|nr:ROK family protein [Bacteroidales bacterium]
MNPETDTRTILTLDAGGTNFVFSAIRGNHDISEPITLPSNGDNLDRCLGTIESGFRQLMQRIPEKPVAISFAFPGPSDYQTGIIGRLNNLPAFRGGIPLGPILEHRFSLPVFINNDGDLYAYGEALSGFLPEVNAMLREAGIEKEFRNLIGVTLGTGFGGGIVLNQELLSGDNSMAGEIWLLRNRINPSTNAEEGISIRAIQRVYREHDGTGTRDELSPKDIFDIAQGLRPGDSGAAKEAFRQLGTVLGDALGNLMTTLDGAAVIGGGLTGAMPLILPAMMEELKAKYSSYPGTSYPRLVQKVFNINSATERKKFLNWEKTDVVIPDTGASISYYAESRLPVGISTIGTSRAIALGAYAFALKKLGTK